MKIRYLGGGTYYLSNFPFKTSGNGGFYLGE